MPLFHIFKGTKLQFFLLFVKVNRNKLDDFYYFTK